MRRFTLALTTIAILSLVSCKDAPTRAGKQLAQEFFDAWCDTAALLQVEQHYHIMDDSLWMPNSSMYLKRAFVETTGKNDSMRAVAQCIAYDIEHYANLQSFRVFEELAQRHITPEHASKLIELIDWSTAMMGKPDYAAAAKERIDKDARSLSVDQQMALYSHVASPTMLGLSLKSDRESPDADRDLISKQIAELEKIYSPEQMQEFRAAYGE